MSVFVVARPFIALSPAQVQEVETVAALLSQDQIADYFGICRNTFRAIRDRDAQVDARYKWGKAKAIAHVANGLLQKARSGDTTSMIFYLKTQAHWRETADQPRDEEVRGITPMSDAELLDCLLSTQDMIAEMIPDACPTQLTGASAVQKDVDA